MSIASDLVPFLSDPRWFRNNPDGIHGVAHTTRVLVWADRLAGWIGRSEALRLFELRWGAAVHDVGRVDDGIDRGHGERSAAWVRAALRTLRPETDGVDLGFVAELCRWHETPDRDIPLLSLELLILKDADALDRARLGDLDPARLRLARSHALIAAAQRLERETGHGEEVSGDSVLRAADRLWPLSAAPA